MEYKIKIKNIFENYLEVTNLIAGAIKKYRSTRGIVLVYVDGEQTALAVVDKKAWDPFDGNKINSMVAAGKDITVGFFSKRLLLDTESRIFFLILVLFTEQGN